MESTVGDNHVQPKDVPPAKHGALGAALDAERRRLSIPGAVVHVSTPEQGSWTKAFGVSDVQTNSPMTTDSRMRVGSVTKAIVATIVLRLVEAGEFHLDDAVHTLLPELPVNQAVTVRQLLNMTSGLPDYTSEEFVEGLLGAPSRVWVPEKLLEIAFKNQQHFEPGTAWEYCNTNYIILGLLIERISDARVEDIAQSTIFDPLGMQGTALPPITSNASALRDLQVRGYHRRNEELVDATDINPSWAWTAGNAVSTAHDLGVFVGALVRGDLLGEILQRERMRALPAIDTVSYGLGIANFNGMWGHNGELPGFQSFAGHDPYTDTTVVVLSNVDDMSADRLAAFVRSRLHAHE